VQSKTCKAAVQSDHHHQCTNIQFLTDCMPFLPPNQQCQSTEGKQLDSFTMLKSIARKVVFKAIGLNTILCCKAKYSQLIVLRSTWWESVWRFRGITYAQAVCRRTEKSHPFRLEDDQWRQTGKTFHFHVRLSVVTSD